jgi:excisionase family DNA binding protein
MCKAVEDRCPGWDQERVRRELDHWPRLLFLHTWKGKHPFPELLHHATIDAFMGEVKDSVEWRKLQEELRRVASKLQQDPSPSAMGTATNETGLPVRKARHYGEPNPEILKGKDTVNRKQAAEAMGVTERTIDRWIKDTQLTPTRIGARIRLKTKELLRLLRGQKDGQE